MILSGQDLVAWMEAAPIGSKVSLPSSTEYYTKLKPHHWVASRYLSKAKSEKMRFIFGHQEPAFALSGVLWECKVPYIFAEELD